MSKLVDAMVAVERELDRKCGEFIVFALLSRTNPQLFDAVVSASWIDADEAAGVRLVSEHISKLPWDLLLQVSGVVAVGTDSQFVADFVDIHGNVTEPVAVGENTYGDIHVIRGYVLTTKNVHGFVRA